MNSEEPVYDRDVIGVEVEVGQFEVTADKIKAFCDAVGETNPLYTDEAAAKAGPYEGIVAPPSFYSSAPRGGPMPDPKVQFGNTTFNAGQHCEFFEPMRPGDQITAWGSVHEIYEKTGRSGRMLFVVRRTSYKNQRGETVALVDSSTVHRRVERD